MKKNHEREREKNKGIFIIYEEPKCFQGLFHFLPSFVTLKYELLIAILTILQANRNTINLLYFNIPR